jgi:tetratricopeptide (TPR) repeat protein
MPVFFITFEAPPLSTLSRSMYRSTGHLMQEQSPFDRAVHAFNNGAFEIASHLADELIATDSRHADALHLRGLVALKLGASGDALTWFSRAVEASPHPIFCNSLSVTQTDLHDYAAAIDNARRGLRMAAQDYPDLPVSILWYNLGRAYHLAGQPQAAAASYGEALAHNESDGGCHNNLGSVLKELGDTKASIAHFERAIELDKHNLEARSNLGHALLAVGRYDDAWPFFEHRWVGSKDSGRLPGVKEPVLPIPRWQEGSLPADARLLVLHEQGFGDALHFCRYLQLAAARFAGVGYACPAPLRQLFQQSLSARDPKIELLDLETVDISSWTHYCSLMSLPMLFGTRVETIPAPVPYLYAEPQAARNWGQRLAALGDPALPRIGLVWAGGHTGSLADRWRSIAPERLAPLLLYRGARWISLQKAEVDAKKLPPAFAGQIIDWMDEVHDFADTAALIDKLDLIIAVDTSVAHLAAAMGKRVWLLNRFAGCWRWLHDRDDTPWYPNMRLFTQRERGDWNDVLSRVRAELERL